MGVVLPNAWQISGLVFENCNCNLLCPGHVSFKQPCTNERCQGHWAIHADTGQFGSVDLTGLNAVIVFDAPQRMYEGQWTQACYIDELATASQRTALDSILSGRAGGPWEILGRFVETRLDTAYVLIQFEDRGHEKRLTIPELFDTRVRAIRGADGTGDAVLENLHNVIHGPSHVLARGNTRCTTGTFDFLTTKSHALYSRFAWSG